MTYFLNFSKQAFKALEKINEPYFSNIKQAIYNLPDNQDHQAAKN
ncbi:MAG: hypothetical protein JWR02_431 [Mucilaginibacter sp.]|nr:hypothetical protein [Mucilaginibacter sp.]